MTLYIKEHPDEFRIATAALPAGLYRPEYRLTVDEPEDVRLHAGALRAPGRARAVVTTREAIALLDREPELAAHQRPPAPQGGQPPLGRAGRRHRRETNAMKTHVRDRRAARSASGQPCYVIAEAGVNHNCDVQLGYKLIETAGAAGADAIKFQSYTAAKISTRVAPRYWVEPADPKGTQWDTFDKLDKLSDRDFKSLLGHARHVGLTAFSTPFDDEAVDFLASLDVPAFKIASADLTCHGLIERAARVGKPMILSTGTVDPGRGRGGARGLPRARATTRWRSCTARSSTRARRRASTCA